MSTQHPGFYYYMAARCTERRRERFLAALDAEAKQHLTMTAPGFSNEKKVEHHAIILELYTRAYELFKAYSPATIQGQGRLTPWITYRIAHTYCGSGKFDMAAFFERIAKTYRREQWDSLLQPLLSTWYSCARKMGDVELSVRLLIEMLGHDIRTQSDDPDSTQEDMLVVLKSSVPSTTEETLVVDSSDSQPILNSSIIFWQPGAIVGEAAAFQISLMARENVSLFALPFSSVTIQFSADIPPIVVEQISGAKESPMKISPKPRKTPHCKTCQRPRAGHPRSGCPYADTLAPALDSSTCGRLESTESLETVLPTDSSIDESRGRPRSGKPDFIFQADVLAASTSKPTAIVVSAAEKSVVPHSVTTDSNSPPARPSTPKSDRPPYTAKTCSLGRTLSQDKQRMFFERARLTSEGSVVILKHPTDGVSDLLARAKTVGLAAEVIGSLGEDSRLVAFGRDEELVSKVGHIGSSEKEAAVDKVKKGCYRALVLGGLGAVVGAVATWTALAFS
ncbi:uncharacterized protein LAESUDRAFT_765393 [Laetiporus sulphureus 93-53]|uniref:Trafficking protein particle complex subunit 11 domain-containing protein n=1 Tax=Laetiporus sulphureus 93-53 TaxID=1314785 RepID=A0A165ASC8_9APHY|nr:uncharacterized protein LAESUDRAFT_765393 [Laetiporus sulphureus 93-53]KZS99569.1 hypothetical protein LAESUDRAFT_765393 [Laetiporus sulphureus 93-53]